MCSLLDVGWGGGVHALTRIHCVEIGSFISSKSDALIGDGYWCSEMKGNGGRTKEGDTRGISSTSTSHARCTLRLPLNLSISLSVPLSLSLSISLSLSLMNILLLPFFFSLHSSSSNILNGISPQLCFFCTYCTHSTPYCTYRQRTPFHAVS
jgi:hypothetical protein